MIVCVCIWMCVCVTAQHVTGILLLLAKKKNVGNDKKFFCVYTRKAFTSLPIPIFFFDILFFLAFELLFQPFGERARELVS